MSEIGQFWCGVGIVACPIFMVLMAREIPDAIFDPLPITGKVSVVLTFAAAMLGFILCLGFGLLGVRA